MMTVTRGKLGEVSQMRRNNCWFGLGRSDLVGPVFGLMMGWGVEWPRFLALGFAFALIAASTFLELGLSRLASCL